MSIILSVPEESFSQFEAFEDWLNNYCKNKLGTSYDDAEFQEMCAIGSLVLVTNVIQGKTLRAIITNLNV